jgi:hypothetical protein
MRTRTARDEAMSAIYEFKTTTKRPFFLLNPTAKADKKQKFFEQFIW